MDSGERRAAGFAHTPPHNFALFAAMKLFGDGEWSLRLPSAMFGIANIAALYWLGAMTGGRMARQFNSPYVEGRLARRGVFSGPAEAADRLRPYRPRFRRWIPWVFSP